MKVFKTRRQLQKWRDQIRSSFHIGFVPTMGALHSGHLSLVKKSKRECQKTVVSIFVNPTQFGPNEDYDKYPRTYKEDLELLEKAGVDCVWIPRSVTEVYTSKIETSIKARPSLTKMMEGIKRPGHFDGVVTVVAKLFQLVQPHRAYFGEKDFQQLKIIEAMVEDLFFPVKIRVGKTVREKSGLAMSSRNRYFSKEDRVAAAQLYQTLHKSQSIEEAKALLRKAGFKVEYLESWKDDLSERSEGFPCRWFVAAQFKTVRLIDNLKKGAE